MILEFKVRDPEKEEDLEAAATEALLQIEKMQYGASLMAKGVKAENPQSSNGNEETYNIELNKC